MKVVDSCVCCDSRHVAREPSTIAPFVVKRIFGWSPQVVTFKGEPLLIHSRVDSVYCLDCGFLFCDWRFDDEEMARLYKNYRGPDYVRERDACEPGYAAINDALGKSQTELITRRNNLQAMLQELIEPEQVLSVLDYGGDQGQFIPDCLGSSAKFVSDISGRAALPGVTRLPKESELTSYDFVMCCQVLEHCSYPREIVRKIKSHSSKYMYFEVPMERTNEPGTPYVDRYSEHINSFDERSLRALLTKEGLRVLDIRVREATTVMGPVKNLMALCSQQKAAAMPLSLFDVSAQFASVANG